MKASEARSLIDSYQKRTFLDLIFLEIRRLSEIGINVYQCGPISTDDFEKLLSLGYSIRRKPDYTIISW